MYCRGSWGHPINKDIMQCVEKCNYPSKTQSHSTTNTPKLLNMFMIVPTKPQRVVLKNTVLSLKKKAKIP